jgi:WD40 repeat protein
LLLTYFVLHRKVYICPQLHPFDRETQFALSVAPANASHSAGAMTWGLEGTSHYLFASSEPHDDDDYNGFHRAFDMNRKKHVFDFDAKEAGDAMALDCHGKSGAIAYIGVDCYSAGERFVLFTRGPAGSHIMRMYDLRRKNKTAIWKSELEPFSTNSNGEVNHARFSPDTIYLAAARSDDVTHIYDSRMIGRGVLHAFEHSGAPRNFPGCETYGVVDLQWVESRTRRLGLVTGGIDGEFPVKYLVDLTTVAIRMHTAVGRL